MNEVNAVIIHDDGNAEVKYVGRDWQSIREVIGGYLEGLSPKDPEGPYGAWRGYCDEEGKLNGRPVNVVANVILTALDWWGAGSDFVVGTVILMGEGVDGEEGDVPDATLKFVLDFYREHGEVDLDGLCGAVSDTGVTCHKPLHHEGNHWGLSDQGLDAVWAEVTLAPPKN